MTNHLPTNSNVKWFLGCLYREYYQRVFREKNEVNSNYTLNLTKFDNVKIVHWYAPHNKNILLRKPAHRGCWWCRPAWCWARSGLDGRRGPCSPGRRHSASTGRSGATGHGAAWKGSSAAAPPLPSTPLPGEFPDTHHCRHATEKTLSAHHHMRTLPLHHHTRTLPQTPSLPTRHRENTPTDTITADTQQRKHSHYTITWEHFHRHHHCWHDTEKTLSTPPHENTPTDTIATDTPQRKHSAHHHMRTLSLTPFIYLFIYLFAHHQVFPHRRAILMPLSCSGQCHTCTKRGYKTMNTSRVSDNNPIIRCLKVHMERRCRLWSMAQWLYNFDARYVNVRFPWFFRGRVVGARDSWLNAWKTGFGAVR